jgi:predicted ATPase
MQDSDQYVREMELVRERVPAFDKYPFSLPAFRNLTTLPLHPSVTFFVGENGTGKSTLLEGLAVAFGLNAEGGSRHFAFSTRETHSALNEAIRISPGLRRPRDTYFLRAESFYNVASQIDELDKNPEDWRNPPPPIRDGYGGKSLHEQSHGESFFALFMNRFRGQGFYILDEPEAALSPARQMSLLTRLQMLVQQGSQFVIATHSPIIMAYPDSRIFRFDEDGIRPVEYIETEHYLVMKRFMGDHEGMLRILLGDRDR